MKKNINKNICIYKILSSFGFHVHYIYIYQNSIEEYKEAGIKLQNLKLSLSV